MTRRIHCLGETYGFNGPGYEYLWDISYWLWHWDVLEMAFTFIILILVCKFSLFESLGEFTEFVQKKIYYIFHGSTKWFNSILSKHRVVFISSRKIIFYHRSNKNTCYLSCNFSSVEFGEFSEKIRKGKVETYLPHEMVIPFN